MIRSFAAGRLFGSVTGGASPQVLALHGWARTHRDFEAVLAPAGGDPLNAIALDLPGFGASPAPDSDWGAAQYAETVGDVLADMDAPVVVLGHSFGGRVAVHLAAQRPEAVHALVLTGVPLLHPEGSPKAKTAPVYKMVRRLHGLGVVSDARMEAARQKYGSADYKAAQGIMRAVLVRSVNETYETELAAITCPVHLVWGSDDTAAPLEVAERSRNLLTQSDLTSVAGVGHMTPSLIPDDLRHAVVSCLP
ncbi:MAG TPA: alpha/beta hydrolase [Acidimicrobiales bacterium]|jgi:pimeloyl-ACP methyl ester carboxylesterase|nr:alpha/beta hydrolase [Acidimicrobiales bacterium]